MRPIIIVTSAIALSMLAVAGCGSNGVAAAEPEPALAIAANSPDLAWGPCPPIFPAGCEIAVLHGDPSAANADVFLRVPPGYEIPPHSHSSAERMILVSGALTVTYQGQAPASLSAGDYAYGPAKAPHKAACVGGASCTLFIAFESAVDASPYEGEL